MKQYSIQVVLDAVLTVEAETEHEAKRNVEMMSEERLLMLSDETRRTVTVHGELK